MTRSEIFKAAWLNVKQNGVSLSVALKAAWAASKAPKYSGREILKISVWKSSDKSDVRIYVSFEGTSEQGVYYKTGNKYNQKGALVGMTSEEKAEALKISSSVHGQGVWGVWYKPTQTQTSVATKSNTEDWAMQELRRDRARGLRGNIQDYLNM